MKSSVESRVDQQQVLNVLFLLENLLLVVDS